MGLPIGHLGVYAVAAKNVRNRSILNSGSKSISGEAGRLDDLDLTDHMDNDRDDSLGDNLNAGLTAAPAPATPLTDEVLSLSTQMEKIRTALSRSQTTRPSSDVPKPEPPEDLKATLSTIIVSEENLAALLGIAPAASKPQPNPNPQASSKLSELETTPETILPSEENVVEYPESSSVSGEPSLTPADVETTLPLIGALQQTGAAFSTTPSPSEAPSSESIPQPAEVKTTLPLSGASQQNVTEFFRSGAASSAMILKSVEAKTVRPLFPSVDLDRTEMVRAQAAASGLAAPGLARPADQPAEPARDRSTDTYARRPEDQPISLTDQQTDRSRDTASPVMAGFGPAGFEYKRFPYLIPGLAALALVIVIGLTTYLVRHRQPSSAPKQVATAFPLQLQAEPQNNGVISIRWNPQSSVLASARGGRLMIADGSQPPLSVALDTKQLAIGHLEYQSAGERVEFRLEVDDRSNSTVRESVLALPSRTGAAPPSATQGNPAPANATPAGGSQNAAAANTAP